MKSPGEFKINKNSRNSQFNFIPRKKEIPLKFKSKLEKSKKLKFDWEDMDFE
jgi:hypothetical protein